ncbi:MAG: UDP-glucose/GDP-mannose dehydrogenase family protein [Desulfobacteraceae bacterium]|nr:UDP-glucose/GDP-mannose dehydrogenase family protein [Desulfobacteraceae bacterium]
MSKQMISLIGLGKLGAPMLACLASGGYQVAGVDVNPTAVRQINEGTAPVFEPGLSDLLRENRERISATEDYDAAIANSQVTFIIVPTPTDERGGFSLEYVLPAVERIGKALRKKSGFHLVVLTSTVLPGAMEKEVLPGLEKYSGKRCAVDFGLCYNPEFIALGSVIKNFLNPDFVLIGESDKRSGEMLEGIYKKVCLNAPPVVRTNFINAEIAKISLNSFITMKITFANMLARICERTPGADAEAVTGAIGMDSRIGSKYLKGALGYGGPCFPRDNLALSLFCRESGIPSLLPETVDRLNRMQVAFVGELVEKSTAPGSKVAVLGLSYKPDTAVVEESQGIKLALELAEKGRSVQVYDPFALENSRAILKNKVHFASSLEKCLESCDTIIIATPWEEFKLVKQISENTTDKPTVVDCWSLLAPWNYERYVCLGKFFTY